MNDPVTVNDGGVGNIILGSPSVMIGPTPP
jgi:hypothetical protein